MPSYRHISWLGSVKEGIVGGGHTVKRKQRPGKKKQRPGKRKQRPGKRKQRPGKGKQRPGKRKAN